jgi:Ca-activated chloride channel family protein
VNFLAPIAFAFAAAIPVVIVFYLLKRKRVVKLVSSTLLWQKFLAETQASAPFQRLRHNWLLILQLLLLALVICALARPYFSGQATESQLRVIILDASASMQATDEKPSRFEKARGEALHWVDGLRKGEQMMVLLAGATTEVKQSPTSDKAALRRALQACTVSDAPTRLSEALKTASAFTYEKRGQEEKEVNTGEIHLFSDGAFPPMTEFENKNLPLVYHRVGQGCNNLGIISLDVRANPEKPGERAIFVSVGNYSTNAQRTDLELLFDNHLIETRPLDLAPTNTQPLVLLAPQSRNGVFTVRLTARDDLAADNQASIVSLMPQPVKVLLVSRGNQVLEKALRSQPNVQLSVATLLTDTGSAFDVVVLDDVIPLVWPSVNTLAIHTADTNWFSGWRTIQAPAIVDWKSTHPLLRFVNFDNVFIAETLGVKTPPWGVALVDSPQTPLIIAGERERHRRVWIGFDTLDSSWPLRISFPIFMVNAIEWLNPASANASQLLVRAGDPFRFGLPTQPISNAQVTKPDGTKKSLAVEPGAHEIVFGETDQQGIYTLRAGTNDLTFCVNLTDAAESNILPHDELPFGKYGKVAATTLKRANLEVWRWIAAAGLLVLLFEWWWYHRRTV